MGTRSIRVLIDTGLRMGSFLNDGGWFEYSIIFLSLTVNIILKIEELTTDILKVLLECYKL